MSKIKFLGYTLDGNAELFGELGLFDMVLIALFDKYNAQIDFWGKVITTDEEAYTYQVSEQWDKVTQESAPTWRGQQ